MGGFGAGSGRSPGSSQTKGVHQSLVGALRSPAEASTLGPTAGRVIRTGPPSGLVPSAGLTRA